MRELSAEQKNKIASLLEQMTIEEKIGQLNQISPSIVGGFDVSFEELIEMMTDGRISKEEFGRIMAGARQDYHDDVNRAGGLSSVLCSDPEVCNQLQKIAVEETRLGIPLIFGFDVIHGFRTVVPIALAEAGTFEPELMEKSARIAAKESRASGISWHFSPMVDISRDARWGRISEGPGEDPYLASVFARAKVRGQQGDDRDPSGYVASCLKHYVAYGACESGRDYNTVSMAKSMLHNAYLPPFKAAVEEGAATVMASFNGLNGVPCTMNEYTLRTVLREKYGFDGFVVSDANAIKECIIHGYAQDEADAAEKALNAGMDMDMGTWIYSHQLKKAVEEGRVPMERLDDAVRRILQVKMWLGLFDKPYVTEEEIHRYDVLPQEHLDHALEAAEKSIVLLKNEKGLLPLKKDQKISLIGALAAEKEEVLGSWALSGRASDCVTIQQGLMNAGADFSYYPCCTPESEINEKETDAAIAAGDILVAVVGEYASMSGEASSRADITLPGKQRELLGKLVASGKPVVALLMNGRPLALPWESEHIPAIVECWHLGIQMGNAVARVLFGEVNPGGKLTCTFPSASGQCPMYYNAPKTGRPGSRSKFTSRYLDVPSAPLYPFGFGLSYTTFEYGDLVVEQTADALAVSVTLKNTGDVAGSEVVQLYMHDVAASLVRPAKELKGFRKVTLEPGESRRVTVALPKEQMGFYDDDMEYYLEDGAFILYMGGNSRDCLSETVTVKF
ncbi:MAG: glycoside hydrolase family 3 C-terminal domain-containing protein [Clostridiales bacterium]|nr:glycoside hydrolase family 3 C-terminal domain-containing protein [Clostridiales bacterium]